MNSQLLNQPAVQQQQFRMTYEGFLLTVDQKKHNIYVKNFFLTHFVVTNYTFTTDILS